jgi:hypothetical protein
MPDRSEASMTPLFQVYVHYPAGDGTADALRLAGDPWRWRKLAVGPALCQVLTDASSCGEIDGRGRSPGVRMPGRFRGGNDRHRWGIIYCQSSSRPLPSDPETRVSKLALLSRRRRTARILERVGGGSGDLRRAGRWCHERFAPGQAAQRILSGSAAVLGERRRDLETYGEIVRGAASKRYSPVRHCGEGRDRERNRAWGCASKNRLARS